MAINEIEQYIQAATRENTRQSYQAPTKHYEVRWGGLLPATADNVEQIICEQLACL